MTLVKFSEILLRWTRLVDKKFKTLEMKNMSFARYSDLNVSLSLDFKSNLKDKTFDLHTDYIELVLYCSSIP